MHPERGITARADVLLLSYVSTSARSDAKYRKTEIKVNRTGVQLYDRAGSLAPR